MIKLFWADGKDLHNILGNKLYSNVLNIEIINQIYIILSRRFVAVFNNLEKNILLGNVIILNIYLGLFYVNYN